MKPHTTAHSQQLESPFRKNVFFRSFRNSEQFREPDFEGYSYSIKLATLL